MICDENLEAFKSTEKQKYGNARWYVSDVLTLSHMLSTLTIFIGESDTAMATRTLVILSRLRSK